MGGYSVWSEHWSLDRSVTFLNHGSFGACPTEVLARQTELRRRLEEEPVRFFMNEHDELIAGAREALGNFIGAQPDDLAFVTNATSGVNTVLRSLQLGPGDELLVTDHEYNACRNAIDFAAERAGAQVIEVPIPFPLESADQVLDAVVSRVTKNTRIALVDHVTSPTGLVFPIERIVAELAERGVDTLVDGAHSVGMVDLDLEKLGAAYFTGNCHKWLCTPKGVAVLHVRRDRQELIRPLVISHGANRSLAGTTRFRAEFDWLGTTDSTAAMCIPDVITFFEELLPGGWVALRDRNRLLALEARDLLCDTLKIAKPAPDDMIGALAAVPLPVTPLDNPNLPWGWHPIQTTLFEDFKIQVPVTPWPDASHPVLRVSAQLYNSRAQYQELATALSVLLREKIS